LKYMYDLIHNKYTMQIYILVVFSFFKFYILKTQYRYKTPASLLLLQLLTRCNFIQAFTSKPKTRRSWAAMRWNWSDGVRKTEFRTGCWSIRGTISGETVGHSKFAVARTNAESTTRPPRAFQWHTDYKLTN